MRPLPSRATTPHERRPPTYPGSPPFRASSLHHGRRRCSPACASRRNPAGRGVLRGAAGGAAGAATRRPACLRARGVRAARPARGGSSRGGLSAPLQPPPGAAPAARDGAPLRRHVPRGRTRLRADHPLHGHPQAGRARRERGAPRAGCGGPVSGAGGAHRPRALAHPHDPRLVPGHGLHQRLHHDGGRGLLGAPPQRAGRHRARGRRPRRGVHVRRARLDRRHRHGRALAGTAVHHAPQPAPRGGPYPARGAALGRGRLHPPRGGPRAAPRPRGAPRRARAGDLAAGRAPVRRPPARLRHGARHPAPPRGPDRAAGRPLPAR